jgi:hypothetical protein
MFSPDGLLEDVLLVIKRNERMSQLFENYVEAVMLKNQELHEQARRHRDEARILSTVVVRTMRQLLHARMAIMEVDLSVMDMVNEHLSSTEHILKLPPHILKKDSDVSTAEKRQSRGLCAICSDV